MNNMLEALLNVNPSLYNQIMDFIAVEVRECERRCNAQHNSFSFRMLEHDDIGVGIEGWKYTYNTYSLYPIAGWNDMSTVPTSNCWIFLGWYCAVDLGAEGYLKFQRERVTKSKIPSEIVRNISNPKHMYIDFQRITVLEEQSRINFFAYNSRDVDVTGVIRPIMVRISSRASLNLDSMSALKNPRKVHESSFKATREAMSSMITADQLQELISKMNKQKHKAIGYVDIKDENNNEHIEARAKIDPDHKDWLEGLHKADVCQFCGTKIDRLVASQYCHYCGVRLSKKNRKKAKS